MCLLIFVRGMVWRTRQQHGGGSHKKKKTICCGKNSIKKTGDNCIEEKEEVVRLFLQRAFTIFVI